MDDSRGTAVPAEPRGFGAGVRRAIAVVGLAPERHGAPVSVGTEIGPAALGHPDVRRAGMAAEDVVFALPSSVGGGTA